MADNTPNSIGAVFKEMKGLKIILKIKIAEKILLLMFISVLADDIISGHTYLKYFISLCLH